MNRQIRFGFPGLVLGDVLVFFFWLGSITRSSVNYLGFIRHQPLMGRRNVCQRGGDPKVWFAEVGARGRRVLADQLALEMAG